MESPRSDYDPLNPPLSPEFAESDRRKLRQDQMLLVRRGVMISVVCMATAAVALVGADKNGLAQQQEEQLFETSLQQRFDALSRYACNPKESPQACIDARSHTEVAFVDFGMGKPELGLAAANAMPAYIGRVTQGLFMATSKVLPASNEAQALAQITLQHTKQHPEGCIDSPQAQHHLSTLAAVADAHKPASKRQFGPNTIVVALTDRPSCDESAGGVSNGKHGADIYNNSERSPQYIVEAATHEFGHLLGLGHAGTVEGYLPNGKRTSFNGYLKQATKQINLRQYVEGGKYEEYGDTSNIMGASSASASESPSFDPGQEELLRRPETTLDGDDERAVPIDKQWKPFTKKAVEQGKFSVVTLAKPFSLLQQKFDNHGQLSEEFRVPFNQLLIVPGADVNSVELVLKSEENSFASLGTVPGNTEGTEKQFNFLIDDGGEVITINIQKGSIATKTE